MKKRILLALLFLMPIGSIFAQPGETSSIMRALVEARATAIKIKAAAQTAKDELRSTYQNVAGDLIRAIESLRTTVEDISDPVALQKAETKIRIALQAIKALLTAMRANDAMRMSEKSKSTARALEEVADVLNIEPAEQAAEEAQEAIAEEEAQEAIEEEYYSVY